MDDTTQVKTDNLPGVDLNTLKLLVRNRAGIVFDEEIVAVSSTNQKGLFDVLPEHENFISVISDKLIIHKKDGTKQELVIGRGVIRVSKNAVRIYIVSDTPEAKPVAPSA